MTVKDKVGIGAQMALQIIDEGKRPMSPNQIKAKYKLGFPFTVKRVVAGYYRDSKEVIPAGEILTFLSIASNGYLKIAETGGHQDPDSERFVYLDGGVS